MVWASRVAVLNLEARDALMRKHVDGEFRAEELVRLSPLGLAIELQLVAAGVERDDGREPGL